MGIGAIRAMVMVMTVIVAAPAGAQDSPQSAPSGAAATLIQNCDAHKFETTVDTTVDGQPHRSRVKLCGNDGQTDSDWVKTLKDAVSKIAADKDMAAATRNQIIAALDIEIARIGSGTSPMRASGAGAGGTLVPRAAPQPNDLTRDFSVLPPLTAPPAPAPDRPMPTLAMSPPPSSLPPPVAAPPSLLSAPRLTFSCFSPGDVAGDAPCTGFDRDTVLTVRARGDVTAGTGLRFLRNGQARTDVALAAMKRGKSIRFPLPREVCAGVGDGSLKIEILSSGQQIASEGPFSLRC